MLALLRFACLAPLLLTAVACGPADEAPAGSVGGTGSSAGGGGGSGSSVAGGGGGSGSPAPLSVSGQALGGGDQGMAFAPGEVVQIEPPMIGGSSAGGSGGGSGIPGDGKSMEATLRRGMRGTAVFTQTGEDVTLVIELTNCSDGAHTVTINDGYACDSAVTEGVPWGERGTGFGPILCSGGTGMLEYTRSGADKSRNWTVADHVQETDVTAHVLIFSDGDDIRAGCANFF